MSVAGAYEIETIRTVVAASRDVLRPAIEDFGASNKHVQAAADIVTALRSLGDAVLAMEQIAETSAECAKKLRLLMARTMTDTGGTRIEAAGGTWTTAKLPDLLEVDEAAVPDDCTITKRVSDRAAIKARLKAGPVNWARWITERGETAHYKPRKD